MFCAAKYRGGVRKDGGVKNTLSESNRGGLEYKQAPDNCGGASWFVLLAVEKNEQINDLFQPLSSETAVPSVSPLYFPTETQGRRLNCYCALLLSGKTR